MAAWLQQAWSVVLQLLPEAWSVYWPNLPLIAVFLLLERWRPIEPGQPWRPVWFNFAWYSGVVFMVFVFTLSPWGAWILKAAHIFGPPLLPPSDSPAASALRVALVLMVHDGLVYWGHRAMHATPFLWAIHRLHHDEEHVNASTSLRQHWLSIPVHQLVVFLPVAWLFGLGAMSMTAFWVTAALGAFHHANLRVELGWLTPLITGPQVHRVHHARAAELHDKNFASLFPLWDILFGTWHRPQPGEFRKTGLEGVPPSTQLLPAQVQPMADWWRAVVEAIKLHAA